MSTQSAGLYVHFPYCVSICNYCDFDRQATGFSAIPRYVESVAAEIKLQARRPLHSIFFGGGTPSLMTPEQVGTILTAAAETFDVLPDAEITVEVQSRASAQVKRLSGFRAAGGQPPQHSACRGLDNSTLRSLSRRPSAEKQPPLSVLHRARVG